MRPYLAFGVRRRKIAAATVVVSVRDGPGPVNTAGVGVEEGRPVTGYAFFDAVLEQPGSVVAMAHRGGALHPDLIGVENTLHAFRHAAELGYRYLETDVHVTRDGRLVAFHDAALDRMTGQPGALASVAAEELAQLRIGGEHAVPWMAELLEELPQCRFNIDLKAPGAVPALADLVERTGARDRVCVGSFSSRHLQQFRRLTRGSVATSATPAEVAYFLAASWPRVTRMVRRRPFAALQIPRRHGRLRLVTRSVVRRAHAAGLHVHVWTVDEPAEMVELLDIGVDGLITDRTDLLKDVLLARGLWRDLP
jgi:glycerophosphoryl diester phosphodiesterase